MHNDQSLHQLRQSVENTLGFPLRTPKDFDALSDSILKKVNTFSNRALANAYDLMEKYGKYCYMQYIEYIGKMR